MPGLWLFNPDNDLALASDKDNYTPPMAAVRLRRSGAALPMWLGAAGDAFLCAGINNSWFENCRDTFGLVTEPWNHSLNFTPRPWGWSRAARATFLQAGFSADSLPSDFRIDQMRKLSSRATAIEVHGCLAAKISFDLWDAGMVVNDSPQLCDALERWPQAVVKTLWSSSGRGLDFVDAAGVSSAISRAQGAIRRYGAVTVEPQAHKMADFAMLFTASDVGVGYTGLSWFEADAHGRYSSNLVASQEAILARVADLYPAERLAAVRNALTDILTRVCREANYRGPIGVDMLLARTSQGVVLHPVVEINFRYTMGFVAMDLARFVASEARFYISAGDTTSACRPSVSCGKLVGGKLALTPPGGDFTFVLEVVQ